MLTGLEHVTEQSLNWHTADGLTEEEVFDSARANTAEEGQEQEDLAEAHLTGRLLACDVIVQHHLGVVLQQLHLCSISQSANLCKQCAIIITTEQYYYVIFTLQLI